MKDFLKMPKTKAMLAVLCGILGVLIVFGLGIAVGYRRAIFSSQFDDGYYRSLYGNPFGQPMVGVMGMGPQTMHGVAGEVIDVSSATISVEDMNGNEASVLVMPDTPIREMNNGIPLADIEPDDRIVVIGTPDAGGQIEAHFIRIFEGSSSPPMPPAPSSQPAPAGN